MATDRLHQLAEARSLALHRAVADRLRSEPELMAQVRARVASWLRDGSVDRRYAEQGRELLELPLERLVTTLGDPGERLTALRQVSPFAGALDPRTRWRIWREVGARWRRA